MNSFFPDCSIRFFSLLVNALKTWFELSKVKLYGSELKGNKNYFELEESSSYQGFKLLRVKLLYKCINEIQEKLMLVRVSRRFEFPRA